MIEPTDEMVQLALDVFLASPTDNITQIDAGMAKALAAVFALAERDQPHPARVLMDAAATARGIADRLAAKPGDGKVWTAMSAGARLVAVRLVELADDADGNGYAP